MVFAVMILGSSLMASARSSSYFLLRPVSRQLWYPRAENTGDGARSLVLVLAIKMEAELVLLEKVPVSILRFRRSSRVGSQTKSSHMWQNSDPLLESMTFGACQLGVAESSATSLIETYRNGGPSWCHALPWSPPSQWPGTASRGSCW